VNVDWYLKATADIPWAFDPEAEKDVIVEANPETPPRRKTGDGVEPEVDDRSGRQETSLLQLGCMFVFGLAFLLIGLGITYAYLQDQIGGQAWGALIVGPVFSLIGGGLLYGAIMKYLAGLSFKDLRVDLEPLVVSPGDTVRCRVRFSVDSKVSLNGVNVSMKGIEHAVDHHGTDSTTYEETFSENEHTLPGAEGTYRKGRTAEYDVEVPVPDDAPPTFQADDNEIRWRCHVLIDVDNWPDWSRSFPVEVVR